MSFEIRHNDLDVDDIGFIKCVCLVELVMGKPTFIFMKFDDPRYIEVFSFDICSCAEVQVFVTL